MNLKWFCVLVSALAVSKADDTHHYQQGTGLVDGPTDGYLTGIFNPGYTSNHDISERVADAAVESPNEIWKPDLFELDTYGFFPSGSGNCVQGSDTITCECPAVLDTGKTYDQLAMEERTITASMCVLECSCEALGTDGYGCMSARVVDGGTKCLVRGKVEQGNFLFQAKMKCEPCILDLTANCQGHGNYEDGNWDKPEHGRPTVSPQLGNGHENYENDPEGWRVVPLHPYRLQCPEGYYMIACHINAPRQHQRSCPVRTKDLWLHSRDDVSPAIPDIDTDQPLLYSHLHDNICQTTSLTLAFDSSASDPADQWVLDPYICKTLQVRCLRDSDVAPVVFTG